MPKSSDHGLAEKMADLTYKLLENCTEKQEYIAEKLNLSISEFRCLRSFYIDTTLSVKELASRMNLTSSRLTRIIDGLVAKNFVTRTINAEDRRVMDVALTKDGFSVTRRLNTDYVSIHEQILDKIPQNSRAAVIRALDDLSNAMSAWAKSE